MSGLSRCIPDGESQKQTPRASVKQAMSDLNVESCPDGSTDAWDMLDVDMEDGLAFFGV